MHPIGIIHSPFTEKDQTPIQASRSQAIGMVEVYPEFADGLQDIDGFSHLILLYAFHLSSGYSLYVIPFLDDQQRGVFATRYPYRPNPIGLSVVRLKMRQGAALTVEGVDVLDGTPLLDIKPYVHDFDVQTGIRTGWYETLEQEMKQHYLVLILMLLADLFVPAADLTTAHAQAASPVVHAVLFYSPTCPHCHYVITETLPPLFEKYGDQLQIIGIDVTSGDGQTLFQAALQKFNLKEVASHSS